ncbi:hypothetical protein IGI04_035870 [Brassica rapa subsp. trilocularis]|uniref:SWIM-type domain-containing protein n=1 Tax=Brassica rapa subsp. trilocularis TaxID=1813537 RepID=A0ABQ7LFL4_BRACM|nr:hypothetical protein IGI04_035870 [Brassica rapa subsp. trilocularis]
MMLAPDTPPIHVTSDRQVRNLLEITKTYGVRFCVSSRSKVETVSEFREEDDEADEADKCFEYDDDDDDLVEDENHDREEDDGEEDAGISIVAEADENGEDYSVYGKVEDEEDDDMCFEDIKKIEGGRSNGNNIYVNQSFVSKDALLSELRLTAITKYVEKHTCSVGDRLAQRRHCTPKYVSRLFIDRVGIIDGLNPQHITDAMKNMFGMTLDYTTSYRALLYAQILVRRSAEDGREDALSLPTQHSRGVEYLPVVRSEIADTMTVQPIDGWRFFVKGGKMNCVVDLEHGKCDCGVYAVEKIPCFHAIAAGTYVGLHISTLVCPVYSKDFLFAGYSENIYPYVRQQVEERTCFPPDDANPRSNTGFIDAQNARKLAIRNHNVRNDVDDLHVSRPEGRPVSHPGFFLSEDLQVSRPVFSLPEDLHVSRPEGRPVSRPGFLLPEDLQVCRPVFSLPEDLHVSRPEGRPVSRPGVFSSRRPSKLMCMLLKYIHRHLIPRRLPVDLSKVFFTKLYPKSMTFNVLYSVHATITSSGRKALNKQIRDHVEKRLHYHIKFFWGDTGTNAVKDDYVPLRDRYPHSNPMSVAVVHWSIDIINIRPPNLVRLPK